MDFSKIKKVYVIGIKGSGVVAVVEILKSLGMEITGSDTQEKFFTDEVLQKLGIKYFEGFSVQNIPEEVDLVVYSTAYNAENNEEFKALKEEEVLMMSYPEVLAELFNQKYGIAVCGTHGKTTTSALLACAMQHCGTNLSAVIGSQVREWGSNALAGVGEYFVIEADEFQNKLKLYEPKVIILTSVDFDHPDTFLDFSEYKKAFADFTKKIPKTGFVVACGDDADVLDVVTEASGEVINYGFIEGNDARIINYQLLPARNASHSDAGGENKVQKFEVSLNEESLGEFEINLIGKHNVLNATAVILACHKLNLDLEKVRQALQNFQGISRRFEIIGERNGAILIDDYGHHPEEIKATLKGAREIYPEKNIIAVFHPHSYSRTEALLQEFSQSFDDADQVIVLDIYGSAREYSGSVNSNDLVKLINKYNHNKAEYIPTISEVVEYLQDKIGANDIVLCIGAGNGREVAEKLRQN